MSARSQTGPVIGVLAGGRGTRLGGLDKARLRAPEGQETLLDRLLRLADEQDLDAVVIGGQAPAGVRKLDDAPPGIGPMGGLCALLTHAGARPAVLLACDLPYLSGELIARLAHAPSQAPVLAARDPQTGKWQPMFARYDAAAVLPSLCTAIDGDVRSFQTWLRGVRVEELPLAQAERQQLEDWDEPGDLKR